MVVKFRLLRVLILRDIYIIPEEIGNLIHLRYFELGGGIEQLPGSIGNLRNLWTLNMKFSRWKRGDGINLCKLKELRHLYLPDDFRTSINMGKLKLEGLEKLKTLRNVRGGELMLLGMTELSVVLEELRVFFISSEEQLRVVFRTPSITWDKLQTLELDWNCDGYGKAELRDMYMLRECKSLKKLKLCGQIQARIDIIFPPNLVKLKMRYTYLKNGELMDIISNSCRHLKFLKLGSMAYWGEKLVCDANSFPQLEKLMLEGLVNLKQCIIESTGMPSLYYLTISWCDHLTMTPEEWTRISEIPQLTIQHCPHIDVEP